MTAEEEARDEVLERLEAITSRRPELRGLWLQGSLARGDFDPWSDVDAYLAVADDALSAVWNGRAAILEEVGPALAWSDATMPGLKAVHALLRDGVRLDLFFEAASTVGAETRQPFRVLVDKGDLAGLKAGWTPPRPLIGAIIAVIVRMTRQGGTWPLRLLHRGQWSTFAMMELDLINAQIAQLMAVQIDPGLFYQNPFAMQRHLRREQRDVLDALTARALTASSARDTDALKLIHLDVFDALVAEGRAACASLGVPYPVDADGEQELRLLLEETWPAARSREMN
jgi:predicted nucleotidyltransferase